jgi:hypothetical protein
VATLTPDDATSQDRVGAALALAANHLLVGAPGADDSDDGTVTVYTRSGGDWTEQATLTAPTEEGDRFGTSLALSADAARAVIGAPADSAALATVAVFERDGSTWSRQATLESPPSATSTYGESVAIGDGGTVVLAGDPGADDVSVHRLGADGWERTARLTGSVEMGSVDAFGGAVALDDAGTTAIVGAPGSDAPGLGSGAAVVFEREDGDWQQVADVTDVDGDSANYGTAVGLDGSASTGFVSAPVPFPDTPNPAGYVTVLAGGDGWRPLTRLETPTGDDREMLGTALDVTVDGTFAAVGDAGDDIGSAVDQGSVSVFTERPSGWCYLTTLTADGGGSGDILGAAVAVSSDGETIVGGAPGATVDGDATGAVYVFGCSETAQDRSVTNGHARSVVDGFERDGVEYDTLVGSADDWTIQSEVVSEGESALQYRGGTTPTELVSFDGRPVYPAAGDRFRFDVRPLGEWDFKTVFTFGQQPDAGFHDRYELELDPGAQMVRLQYDDPDAIADETLGTAAVALDRDTFYTVEIDWLATGSKLVVTIYDGRPGEGGRPVAQIAGTAPEDAPTEGGIGIFANGEGDRWVFDNIRVVS